MRFFHGALALSLMTLGVLGGKTTWAGSEPPEVDATKMYGQRVYAARCQYCHGPNMVSAGGQVYDLRRFPLDDPERFKRSVLKGRGGMPSWEGMITIPELNALWEYVGTRGVP